MAGYTRQNGNAMRRDAMRRTQQMQQRVPYRKPPDDMDEYLPLQEEAPKPEHEPKPDKETARPESGSSPGTGGGFGLPGGIDRLLEQAGSDRMLILALLAILYKDGGSKKLMMALVYLLT
ncbi:MAG: hypothetical protein IJ496_04220 [Ruminococcus sp.]|nr:hypothetical protein [Ruminococcus sp.]